MRGSIRQKSRGSWQIAIDTGAGQAGERRRHFETIRGRKSDAQRKLTELYQGAVDAKGHELIGEETLGKIPVYRFQLEAKVHAVDYRKKICWIKSTFIQQSK